MIHTLWLASWYPSLASAQNGDFIQRHAQAVSNFAKVHVLHVVGLENTSQDITVETKEQSNLCEEIIYYRKRRNGIISRVVSVCKYFLIYKQYIKKYIQEHGTPDITHVHVSMRAGIVALWMKRKYNIPYIITEHWTIYTKERNDNFATKNFLFKYYTRKVFKHASAVLPVSDNLGRNIQKMVINVPYIKVPNVVSNKFSYKNMNHENSEPFIFLHVSSLIEFKNPKGILRTYQKLLNKEKNIFLRIVGKNCNSLKIYAEEFGIPKDKIYFTGEISNDAVAKEMQSADVFILFSQTENSPCVISESLCCGVPVIATDVGGISELVNADNSILISPNNEIALENAMIKMMRNKSVYNRNTIAQQARELYDYATIGKQMVNIYTDVITNNPHQNSASPRQHNP